MDINALGERVNADGFVIVVPGLPAADCEQALCSASDIALEPGRGGIRNLLSRQWVRDLAAHVTIVQIVRHMLGECPIPIKATLFDKTPAANWKVAWH